MEEFNATKPIYLQLADRIKRQIVSNELKLGEKLPSVRDMGLKYSVNPNTIQRTYSELEREGILETRRGHGTFVTEKEGHLSQQRENLKNEEILTFVQVMQEMGFTSNEIILGVQDHLKNMDKGVE